MEKWRVCEVGKLGWRYFNYTDFFMHIIMSATCLRLRSILHANFVTRYSVLSTDYLDGHIVTSAHLKEWMIQTSSEAAVLGAGSSAISADKIHVVHILLWLLLFKGLCDVQHVFLVFDA